MTREVTPKKIPEVTTESIIDFIKSYSNNITVKTGDKFMLVTVITDSYKLSRDLVDMYYDCLELAVNGATITTDDGVRVAIVITPPPKVNYDLSDLLKKLPKADYCSMRTGPHSDITLDYYESIPDELFESLPLNHYRLLVTDREVVGMFTVRDKIIIDHPTEDELKVAFENNFLQ